MSFDRAFTMVTDSTHEGGLVDDPRDPGGLTKYGISQRAYPGEDIRNLTLERAKELYRRDYWSPIRGDQLPDALALCLFDMAVNSGPTQAVRTLQHAIDVPADGILGPGTLGKALSMPAVILVAYFQAERVLFMSKLPEFATFGRGWARRVISTAIEACA
jgi:lysozyme family protein